MLASYLLVRSTLVPAVGFHTERSPVGSVWTAIPAVVMIALAAGKARTGATSDSPVPRTEGRVTLVDGILSTAVLAGVVLNARLGS